MESQNQKMARLVLSRLNVPNASPWQPAWSSLLLQETLGHLLEEPESTIADVFGGLFTHLGSGDVVLTPVVASFALEVIKATFVPYRKRYEAEDFTWLVKAVNDGCAPAQAYFALHALPPTLGPQCKAVLINTLSTTPYAALARNMFDE